MQQPLISVIIPVYNVQQYLEDTLKAVTGQSYTHLEIILVDDGSQDESGTICDHWAQKDSRIRVVHQTNGGPSRARNTGLDMANGEYLLFCDSDDLISPRLCQLLYTALTDTDSDIAVCEYVHIFPNKPYSFSDFGENHILYPEQVVEGMWYQTGFLPSACGKLYRRKIFADIRFREELVFEDIDLLHLVFFAAQRIVHIDAGLYGYLHRSNSITTTPFGTRDLDIFKVTDRILSFAGEHPNLHNAARAYAVAAALRIYLNAPNHPSFSQGIDQACEILHRYGKQVRSDRKVRRKTRYALWLYAVSKPVLRWFYKRINRWK